MPSNPKQTRTGALLGLILACVTILLVILLTDHQDLLLALAAANRPLIILAVIISLLSQFFRYQRWQCCLASINPHIPRLTSLLVFGSGLAMMTTPGRVGELIRCAYLHQAGYVPASASLPIIIAERMTEGLGIFLIAAASLITLLLLKPTLPMHPLAIPAISSALSALLLLLIIIRQKWAQQLTLSIVKRFSPLRRFRSPLQRFWQSTRLLMRREVIVPASILSIASWAAQCLVLYIIIHALDRTINLWSLALILSLSSLVGTISFLPAGLGTMDGSLLLLLVQSGISSSRAIAAVFLFRAMTLWMHVGIGALALAASGIKRPDVTRTTTGRQSK